MPGNELIVTSYLDTGLSLFLYFMIGFIILLFTFYALLITYRSKLKDKILPQEQLQSYEACSVKLLVWALYTNFCGSWVLYSPVLFSMQKSLLGATSYSTSCLFPLYIQSFLAPLIKSQQPDAKGILDYFQLRFGLVFKIYAYIILICCLIIGLIAEYTTIISVFEKVTNKDGIYVVTGIFISTYVYTLYGGLKASIRTDKVQGLFSCALFSFILIYTIANCSVLKSTINVRRESFVNKEGIESLVTMPLSILCSTMFLGSSWQRIWIAYDKKTLRKVCLIASTMIFTTVMFFGIVGFLAGATGMQPNEENTVLVTFLFNLNKNLGRYIVIVVMMLAVSIAQSGVDNLQNAVLEMLTFKDNKYKEASYTMLFIINVAALFVCKAKRNILEYFLLSNLLCILSTPALFFSLIPRFKHCLTQSAAIFGCFTGFFALIIYGWSLQPNFVAGLSYVFFENYGYDSILIAVVSPIIGTGAYITAKKLYCLQQ